MCGSCEAAINYHLITWIHIAAHWLPHTYTIHMATTHTEHWRGSLSVEAIWAVYDLLAHAAGFLHFNELIPLHSSSVHKHSSMHAKLDMLQSKTDWLQGSFTTFDYTVFIKTLANVVDQTALLC